MNGIVAALADEPLPAALVDLDALDRNVDRLCRNKPVRVATKSIRCPEIVRRVAARGRAVGLMTFTAAETAFWAGEGFGDLLLAYPTAQPSDARLLAEANRRARARAVVDDAAQLVPLAAAAAAAGTTIPVVVDVDMSLRALGLHLGVRRSPIHTVDAAVALARRAADTPGLAFDGIMGYEAQIAGLPDRGRASLRALKLASRPRVERLRADVAAALAARGLAPATVNGGGTGSVAWAAAEPALTEITVGSGFLAGHLFDGYRDLDVEPALYFALPVARRPAPGIVTCLGGGYVASGGAGPDRLPLPVWPAGARLLPREGAGEVQTPVVLPRGVDVAPGEPVLFRPAKSGELAERFAEYLLVRAGRIEARAPTYRGLGRCFL
ncbi:MAG TPA: alanine racemase [Haliangiales bacterium]|nr:alanine racemase [Haliangiales bacterium]